MTIYEFRTSMTVAAASKSFVSHRIAPGGLVQQFLVRAGSSTIFRADLTDYKGIVRRNYGFHTGEINDVGFWLPIQEQVTVNITNASPSDTFNVLLAVQE